MDKKNKKPLLNIKLENLGKAMFESDFSSIWEKKFKQNINITEQDGKKTNLVVKTNNAVKSTIFITKNKK